MSDSTMLQNFCEIDLNNDIGMYYCGKRIETENHTYGPEIRYHYLFVLVDKGTAETCDGKKIRFGSHDLFVMCPNTKIHYKALEKWSISWIGLYGKTVKQYIDFLNVTPQNPVLHVSLYAELKSIMDKICTLSKTATFSSNLQISGLIYEFFAILMQNSTAEIKPNLIKSALKIINNNFCEEITVKNIASQLFIDPAYLSRKFTKEVGVPPKKYILKKRIERAKELLAATNEGIFEISNSVGFKDQLYFSRIFKKITDTTPTEYRKRTR